jgi:hypothetical protein
MNRLDKLVVFHPLGTEELYRILDIEMRLLQQRVLELANVKFSFQLTEEARTFLLQEGTNTIYGARQLKRTIERHVVNPLARLVATEQVNLGDVISIDWEGTAEELQFIKQTEGRRVNVSSFSQLTEERPASGCAGRAPSVFAESATDKESAPAAKSVHSAF